MNRISMPPLAGVAIAFLMLSCGGSQETPATSTPASFFPEHIPSIGWSRDSQITRFAGDSLYEYIDGAAEMYHKYAFVELNVAGYTKGDNEVVVDLYRFADADKAFGMYTTLRPYTGETIALGVAGFAFGPSLVFVRGAYMVSLAGYDESDATSSALRSIASAVDGRIPGTTDKPVMFTLIPQQGRLADTEKVFAESFLGQGFLSDVYSVDHALGADTLTLFITADEAGDKLLKWMERAAESGTAAAAPPDLAFDDGKVLVVSDAWHGRIIAGLRTGKLIGIVGYRQEHRDFLATWLASLP